VARNKRFSVRLRVGLAAAAMTAMASAGIAAPLPLSAILAPPVLRGAQLSPSGRYLGLIETDHGRDRIVVMDVQTSARAHSHGQRRRLRRLAALEGRWPPAGGNHGAAEARSRLA
jgi:hypothetical protein